MSDLYTTIKLRRTTIIKTGEESNYIVDLRNRNGGKWVSPTFMVSMDKVCFPPFGASLKIEKTKIKEDIYEIKPVLRRGKKHTLFFSTNTHVEGGYSTVQSKNTLNVFVKSVYFRVSFGKMYNNGGELFVKMVIKNNNEVIKEKTKLVQLENDEYYLLIRMENLYLGDVEVNIESRGAQYTDYFISETLCNYVTDDFILKEFKPNIWVLCVEGDKDEE